MERNRSEWLPRMQYIDNIIILYLWSKQSSEIMTSESKLECMTEVS